jgi:hypothetical protein
LKMTSCTWMRIRKHPPHGLKMTIDKNDSLV